MTSIQGASPFLIDDLQKWLEESLKCEKRPKTMLGALIWIFRRIFPDQEFQSKEPNSYDDKKITYLSNRIFEVISFPDYYIEAIQSIENRSLKVEIIISLCFVIANYRNNENGFILFGDKIYLMDEGKEGVFFQVKEKIVLPCFDSRFKPTLVLFDQKMVGQGSFYYVFSGKTPDGREVAVKIPHQLNAIGQGEALSSYKSADLLRDIKGVVPAYAVCPIKQHLKEAKDRDFFIFVEPFYCASFANLSKRALNLWKIDIHSKEIAPILSFLIIQAVCSLHQKGHCHLDIKPHNIVVKIDKEGGRAFFNVALIDCGFGQSGRFDCGSCLFMPFETGAYIKKIIEATHWPHTMAFDRSKEGLVHKGQKRDQFAVGLIIAALFTSFIEKNDPLEQFSSYIKKYHSREYVIKPEFSLWNKLSIHLFLKRMVCNVIQQMKNKGYTLTYCDQWGKIISGLICFNPEKRMNLPTAMQIISNYSITPPNQITLDLF